jgi:uncharacterized GH25 family protein
MRRASLLLFGLSFATQARAHDFWVQPGVFAVAPQVAVPIIIQVGHGPARQRWGVSVDRVMQFTDIGPRGSIDRRAELHPDSGTQDALLSFASPGTHILVLVSNNASSVLPSIRFNAYLADEGLTPATAERARTGASDSSGREIYSRRAKALIQVGAVDSVPQPQVTRPVGLTLEIVPQKNPYKLKPNEALPVQVIYEGKPLPGAFVKLTNLDFDFKPIAMHRTDANGRASFKVPLQGKWLLNVIWTKPVRGNPNADFETIFSSLTFGFSRSGATASRTTQPGGTTASPDRP